MGSQGGRSEVRIFSGRAQVAGTRVAAGDADRGTSACDRARDSDDGCGFRRLRAPVRSRDQDSRPPDSRTLDGGGVEEISLDSWAASCAADAGADGEGLSSGLAGPRLAPKERARTSGTLGSHPFAGKDLRLPRGL